jgi:hypothetical protein
LFDDLVEREQSKLQGIVGVVCGVGDAVGGVNDLNFEERGGGVRSERTFTLHPRPLPPSRGEGRKRLDDWGEGRM